MYLDRPAIIKLNDAAMLTPIPRMHQTINSHFNIPFARIFASMRRLAA
ncbi:hypothetical protein [Bradyrhizobium liaoningense]|nr:hypothetical protein [Bradyrhizobium liaoningense]MBR0903357.1 hypothetical protein [Bradyrhizobium liaoningense]